jgi:hypothetical protein
LTSSLPERTPTWTFTRGPHQLTIRKTAEKTLVIQGREGEEQFDFDTVEELIGFQVGFEDHLLEAGWSLIAFSPEQRSGRERRLMPRGRDRRRRFPRLPWR